MSDYKLIFKAEAKEDIEQSYFYYESRRLNLGERFLDTLQLLFQKIKNHPYHFPEKNPHFREAVVKKFPFIVVFEVFENEIIVYAVFNTWQNPGKKPNK